MMNDGDRDRENEQGSAHSGADFGTQSGSWDDLKEDLSDAVHETVAGRGREFIEAAKRHAAEYAAGRKDGAARSVEDVAHSLRESGRAFEDTPHIRAFVDSAAVGLENFAADIRDRPLDDLYADAEDFARRHPVAIATGASLAGLMIARFFKSSSARRVEREREQRIRDAERRFARSRSARGTASGDEPGTRRPAAYDPSPNDPESFDPTHGGGDADR
ncbi:MAG TPA: hypothetical protein VLQ65_10345 [Saliniramus sp.]|nr:hypothetical protein [Saliniramus sp.]